MIGWLAQALAGSACLSLVVLLVRGWFRRAFGARVAYALWILPVLRLVLPPLPASWTLAYFPPPSGLAMPWAATLLGTPPPLPLAALWLAGALIWLALQMGGYHLFLRRALHGAVPLSGAGAGVAVLLSAGVEGPAAAGILHRRIFLPQDFGTRYGVQERRCALLHEHAHHARGDLAANLAALGFLSAHWWNPLAHAAYRAFRSDQELACDASVSASLDPADREHYARALLKSAAFLPGLVCALGRRKEMATRLRGLSCTAGGPRRQAAGALSAALLVVVSLAGTSVSRPGAPMQTVREGARTRLALNPPQDAGVRLAAKRHAQHRPCVIVSAPSSSGIHTLLLIYKRETPAAQPNAGLRI